MGEVHPISYGTRYGIGAEGPPRVAAKAAPTTAPGSGPKPLLQRLGKGDNRGVDDVFHGSASR